jgi:hypothetical protein
MLVQVWIAIAAGFTARLTAQSLPLHLWAASDGVRVNPVTSQVYEQHLDIHKDYPAGDFRAANSVWNATSKTVSLKAARNEFVAFQVIVEASKPTSEVNASFSGLTGPNGARIDGQYAAVFKEWYVHVRRAESRCALTCLSFRRC